VGRTFDASGGNSTSYGAGFNVGPGQLSFTRSQPDNGKATNTYGYGGEIMPNMSASGSVTTGDPKGTKYNAELSMKNILQGLFSAGVELTPEQKAFAFYGKFGKSF